MSLQWVERPLASNVRFYIINYIITKNRNTKLYSSFTHINYIITGMTHIVSQFRQYLDILVTMKKECMVTNDMIIVKQKSFCYQFVRWAFKKIIIIKRGKFIHFEIIELQRHWAQIYMKAYFEMKKNTFVQ